MKKLTLRSRSILAAAVLMFCACMLCLGGSRVQAATVNKDVVGSDGYWNAGDHSFQADLNNDGTEETIDVTLANGDDDYLTSMQFSCNGKVLLKKSITDAFGIQVRFIKMADDKIFLQIYGCGEDDWTAFNYLYQYNNASGKLKKIGNFAVYFGNSGDISKVTKNTVTVNYYAQPDMLGGINYKLVFRYADGKLQLKSSIVKATSAIGNTNPGTNDGLGKYFAKNKFRCAKKLTFYSSETCKTKAFTVSKGKFVTLTKVKVTKKNIYAQFKYGKKTGWLNKLNKFTYTYSEKAGTFVGGDFDGVCSRLAG